MNAIQGKKPAGRQWNILLDEVVTIIKYKKSTIYHGIYIKVFTDGTVSYFTFSTDDFLNTTNNETAFPELIIVLKNTLRLKYKKDQFLSTYIFGFPVYSWFQC